MKQELDPKVGEQDFTDDHIKRIGPAQKLTDDDVTRIRDAWGAVGVRQNPELIMQHWEAIAKWLDILVIGVIVWLLTRSKA